MTLPANNLANLRRRVNRARRFPDNTCPASRHAQQIAEQLIDGRMLHPEWRGDGEHMATSILSVLESLWKARTELRRLKAKP